MLARRLTTILPAMSLAEALETTGSHRVARRSNGHTALGTLPSPREHVMLRNPSEACLTPSHVRDRGRSDCIGAP